MQLFSSSLISFYLKKVSLLVTFFLFSVSFNGSSSHRPNPQEKQKQINQTGKTQCFMVDLCLVFWGWFSGEFSCVIVGKQLFVFDIQVHWTVTSLVHHHWFFATSLILALSNHLCSACWTIKGSCTTIISFCTITVSCFLHF